MKRFFRVSALAAAVLALAVPAVANIPDAALSVVPTFVTIAPDGGGTVVNVTVQVNGALGGVGGAFVTIEFSADATALIAWSDPVPSGADFPFRPARPASTPRLRTAAAPPCSRSPAAAAWLSLPMSEISTSPKSGQTTSCSRSAK